MYRMDQQEVLLQYSTGAYIFTGTYIQYPVVSHNGKEYTKECIYMYN